MEGVRFAFLFSITATCFTLGFAEAQDDLSWRLVDHPRAARDIAVSFDGTVFALNTDNTLWVNKEGGADAAWSKLYDLPSDTDDVTTAAGLVYFQRADRTLWYVDRNGRFVRVGRPWGAAEVAGTEDSSLDVPVLYALNDDKTFWVSGTGGADNSWTRKGQPRQAKKIAASQSAVFSLNTDGSIWFNRNQGTDTNWQRIGDAPQAKEIAAANDGQSDKVRLYALNTDASLWTATFAGIVDNVPPDTGNRVDLRGRQTRLKEQGSRNTCITFAAIAALEAAYKRAGYGDLDLSEEFLNHTGKMFWLHPRWNEIFDFGEDGSETQVGAFGGGGGTWYVEILSRGFKTLEEPLMPYHNREYRRGEFDLRSTDWQDPVYRRQRNKSDFNLHRELLADRVLKAPRYYSVREYESIDAKDAATFERVLQQGYDIVWDFQVANTPNPGIWQPCAAGQANCPSGAHAMLIVGYDKTNPDPKKHYFIAKNTWGPTQTPDADGYTLISYSYLRQGISAAYIKSVNPPSTWSELAFIGRWNIDFDGWKGTLDIYHIPGIMQALLDKEAGGVEDRRVGSYYDSQGNAFKVNGSMKGNRIEFYIDGNEPRLRWDRLQGRKFVYYLNPKKNLMTGFHTDPDGRTWAGYAVKSNFLPGGTQTTRPLAVTSYVNSSWSSVIGDLEGNLRLSSHSQGSPSGRLAGEFVVRGSARRYPVTAQVKGSDPSSLQIVIATTNGQDYRIEAKHLSHEPGVVSGYVASPSTAPFYMVRQ